MCRGSSLLMLLVGCAPNYYEAGVGRSVGTLAPRGSASLDTEEDALMFTVGWNPQAERHHREQLLETARGTGRMPLSLMTTEDRASEEESVLKRLAGQEPPDDPLAGLAYLLWALGVGLIILCAAVLRYGSSLWKKNGKPTLGDTHTPQPPDPTSE